MLNNLSTKECLVYGNSIWRSIIEWIRQFFESDDHLVKNLLQIELDTFISTDSSNFYSILSGSNRIAKLTLMLSDVDEATSSSYSQPIFELLVDKLTSCNKHVYASVDKTEKFIFIFHFMMHHLNRKHQIIKFLKCRLSSQNSQKKKFFLHVNTCLCPYLWTYMI